MKKWLFILLIGIISCKSTTKTLSPYTSEPTKVNTENTSWKMTEFIQNGKMQKMPQDIPMLEFMDHFKIAGNGGCNQLMGGYELTGGNGLIIRLSGRTMAYCQDMPFEDAYVSALEQIKFCYIENDIMTLKDGNNTITLKYRKF